MKKLNLYQRILLSGSLVVLACVLLIVLVLDKTIKTSVIEKARSDLVRAAVVFENFEDFHTNNLFLVAQVVGDSPIIKSVMSIPHVDHSTALVTLSEFKGLLENDALTLLTPQGVVVAKANAPSQFGEDLSWRSDIAGAITGEVTLGTHETDGVVYRNFSMPVTVDEKIVGILSASFRFDEQVVGDLVAMTGVQIALLRNNKVAFVTEERSPFSYEQLRADHPALWSNERLSPTLEQASLVSLNGNQSLVLVQLVAPYPQTNISYVLRIPLKEALSFHESLKYKLALIGLVSFLASIILGSILAKSIVQPIKRLVQATKEISKGQLEQLSTCDTSAAEIEELASSFNDMSRQLSHSTVRKEYLDGIIENMVNSLIVLDSDLRIKTVNPATLHLLDYPSGQLEGKLISEILRLDGELDTEKRLMSALTSDGKIVLPEASFVSADSSLIPISFSGSLMKRDGLNQGVVIEAIDMRPQLKTKQELLRSIQEANDATRYKSEFLANMSHEIRTPLNGIMGMAELLTDTSLSQDQEECLGVIRSSSSLLYNLVNEILDFSKIEADKIAIDSIEFNLVETLREVLSIFQVETSKKDISQVLHLTEIEEQDFIGDPLRIQQILINLIGNSVKFTPRSGGIILYVAKVDGDAELDQMHFVVSDSGIGISEADQEKIFDEFIQADGSVTRVYGGTGLGLTISKRLVELMGGSMWLKSLPGVGSAFHFQIPLRKASADASDSRVEQRPPPRPVEQEEERVGTQLEAQQNGAHVLLVDDVESNLLLVEKILERKGYQVSKASNGQQALTMLEQQYFDIVLMDIQMPVMDGLTATRKFRSSSGPTGPNTPVVALTAHAMEDDKQRCLDAGMDDYVTKPIVAKDLLATIQRLLSQ